MHACGALENTVWKTDGRSVPMTSEFNVAVHALVYLHHKNKTVSSEELAENICTNPARVRKVLSKLRKADLVVTKEGAEGGYQFVLDAEKVTLGDVGDALDLVYVSAGWKSGDTDMDCLVASGMAAVMDDIYGNLNAVCRRYLNRLTIHDIDAVIFKSPGKAGQPAHLNTI